MQLEVKRRMGEADIAAVSELLHVATVADEHLPLGEHMWLDLVEGGRTGFAGFVAWWPGPITMVVIGVLVANFLQQTASFFTCSGLMP